MLNFCFSGFTDEIEGKYVVKLKGPVLRLVGKYKINGNILILPIQGVGDSNISISKLIHFRFASR